MQVEVVAIGTELLLGQITDTNSAWLGQRLAASGIDCFYQTRVGDNVERITSALRVALGRADAVITTGGLGPTQDDCTREALAQVMGVDLERRPEVLAQLEELFRKRSRQLSPSNARQADAPRGSSIIPFVGTAPGLICPVGNKVIYSLPGVPWEMREMFDRAVLPDLRARGGQTSVILSRVLRTWGLGEAKVAELLAGRFEALERHGSGVKLAFLASGVEGVKVRLTVKAPDKETARSALEAEEREIRALLGDAIFGVDDEGIEHAVAREMVRCGMQLALAESLTGGMASERLVRVPGASGWYRGAIVSYSAEVKYELLGVPRGPVVSPEAALAMAEGVRRLLRADVGVGITGVSGPDPAEGVEPGVVYTAVAGPSGEQEAAAHSFRGDRQMIRQFATIAALDQLRRVLMRQPSS